MRKLAGFLALALLAGCAEEPTPPNIHPPTVKLSAAQANAIRTRVALAVTGNVDLAWLADSVNLVVTSGAEAKRIVVNTNFGVDEYYAVSIKREFSSPDFSWSTFDVIAFDDATDPTHLIILGGFRSTATNSPPISASGTFGGNDVRAWLFEVSSGNVRAWRATGGTAAFTDGLAGGACIDFPDSAGVTCTANVMQASMNVTATEEEDADFGELRTATLATVTVPGILIEFE